MNAKQMAQAKAKADGKFFLCVGTKGNWVELSSYDTQHEAEIACYAWIGQLVNTSVIGLYRPNGKRYKTIEIQCYSE
jgi:hypothetical protein